MYEQGLLAMSERVTEVSSGEILKAPAQVPLEEKLEASRVTELPLATVPVQELPISPRYLLQLPAQT